MTATFSGATATTTVVTSRHRHNCYGHRGHHLRRRAGRR